MSQTNTPEPVPSSPERPTHDARSLRRRGKSFERRVKAAGLDDQSVPDDIEEARNGLTRRLYMFLNQWRGCPEPICRRNRGCMAPNVVCANVPPESPEEQERGWREVQAEVYKTLQAHLAARGVEDP